MIPDKTIGGGAKPPVRLPLHGPSMAAKLLMDVRCHTKLVTAASDSNARVQLRFLDAPNAISLDAKHLCCLLNQGRSQTFDRGRAKRGQ